MMLAARGAFLAARRKPRLPYDAEVEYLESTGTQWIDTGVFPFSDDYTSFEYRASTASRDRSVIVSNFHVSNTQGVMSSEFGGRSNSKPFCPRGYTESTIGSVSLFGDALSPNEPVDVVVSFTVSSKVLSLSVNGGTPQTMSLGRTVASAAYTLALFKDRRASLAGFANSVRIYHMDILSGSGYVRRFVPVRFTNEQGVSEGAMYDRVSKQLFRNQGTGSFVVGPDVCPYSTPVMGLHFMRDMGGMTARDYIQDGLIAMWDGIENAGYGVHDAASAKWVDLSGNGWSLTKNSGEFASDHYVLGGVSCATISTMPHGVQTIEIVFQNYGSAIECIIWATDKDAGIDRQVCWIRSGGLGFGYNGKSKATGSSVNHYACTFGTNSDRAPSATFFNGAQETFSGPYDYFSSTYTGGGMRINPRQGTVSGGIYSLRLYSRALSSAEIAANYAIDRERFNLP